MREWFARALAADYPLCDTLMRASTASLQRNYVISRQLQASITQELMNNRIVIFLQAKLAQM